jgi:tetratricopeptide (TPR) repeat protein/tRNA A-37 threonylcarbamoyl transferase component Bud32
VADVPDRLRTALADRYTIERELGAGGMATVYLALDVKHERNVAVKVLHPEIAAAIGPERFLREMKITSRLTHPHILPLLDSGEAEGLLYYTMPFVDGETLRDRLDRDKQLPVEEALRFASEVADALGSAHRHDVVHRDIKPENILLEEGHAVVADFGIARAISEAGSDRLTETGISVGTPCYMSPEQGAGERTLDGRSDIYALGCVLYEMLAGQVPFTGPTVESIVRQHIAAEPNPVTSLRPTVPAAVSKTLTRSLAKSPADRPATALAFADELRSENATVISGGADITAASRFPFRMVGLLTASALLLLAVIHGLMLLLGLPNWVFAAAAAIAVAGLPLLLFTGYVEQNRSAAIPLDADGSLGRVHSWISWRRFLVGTAIAFSALGVVAAGHMLTRALGIGPAATLITQGALSERDPLILADIEDFTGDSTLARALTEAIRTDLTQSPVVTLVSTADVAAALSRMERAADARVPASVAIEIAQREGLKAVVAGEVHAAGIGYVLSGRVIAAESNEVLTAVRATARDSTRIVDAIDQISAKLRERVGESLRTIRRSPTLSRVTTASLPALRRYTDALVADEVGDVDRALALLEEAVEIDTAFAMAYRKLGMIMGNRGISRAQRLDAFTKAYEHRDRLTERERYLAMAAYESHVKGDDNRAIQAYEAMLRLNPEDSWALNNLGVQYDAHREYARAVEAYARAFELDTANSLAITNLVIAYANNGDLPGADSAISIAIRLFPANPTVAERQAQLAYAKGEHDHLLAIVDSLQDVSRSSYWRDFRVNLIRSFAHAGRGKPGEFRQHFANVTAYLERAGLHGNSLNITTAAVRYELLVRGDRDDVLSRLETALERNPLDEIPPAERPYGSLAGSFAAFGQVERARQLIDEAERVLDQGLLRQASPGLPGQPDSAIAVFERYAHSPNAYTSRLIYDAGWLPSVYVQLGELYEERGDRGSAAHYYNEFVELWTDADPELQPQVEEVRQRIARLVGEPQR